MQRRAARATSTLVAVAGTALLTKQALAIVQIEFGIPRARNSLKRIPSVYQSLEVDTTAGTEHPSKVGPADII
jgi:hypothetical protein